MEVFDRIINFLDSHDVAYKLMHHEPTLTSEDSARIRGEALSKGAKAILMKVESEFMLFVFPANRKINSKEIRNYLKSLGKKAKKIRFASRDELFQLTGLVPGSVPPFGEPILPFPIYADKSLVKSREIAFNAGSLTDSVFMDTKIYLKISSAIVFDFTE